MGSVTDKTTYKAVFPLHLAATGSKYYRAATLAQVEQVDTVTIGFETAEQIAHWLLRHGPVRIRFRWHKRMWNVDRATGHTDVVGDKQGRVTCLLMGFDSGEAYPFRVLTPHGSGFGQVGRCWLSWDGLRKLLREGAVVDAPEL